MMPGSNILSVTTLNTHLWGRLALIGENRTETPLYLKDDERVEGLVQYFRENPTDVLALQEVWDPLCARRLYDGLKDIYPYRAVSPWAGGMDDAIRALNGAFDIPVEDLEAKSHRYVLKLAQNHYKASSSLFWSLMGKIVPEDFVTRVMHRLMGSPHIWGAGLLFLSQHPIDMIDNTFVPHPVRADLERFARKGVQNLVVHKPEFGPVRFLHTHLQEGQSRKAVKTRTTQIRALRKMMDHAVFPTVVVGDFNVERDLRPEPVKVERRQQPRRSHSDEYRLMKEILGTKDAYAKIFHERLGALPGYTYLHGPFARHMGVPDHTPEQALTVDYIQHTRALKTIAASVNVDGFFLGPDMPLSDHRPLSAMLIRWQHAEDSELIALP